MSEMARERMKKEMDETERPGSSADPCGSEIDRLAPAGSRNSLGAMSDCNGRPATSDDVTEAIDEQPPLPARAPVEEGH